MSFEGRLQLSGAYIPQSNRLVPTGTGEGFAVWCKRHRIDPARMSREQGDFGLGVRIVEPDIEVAGHRQLRTIGRIGDRVVTSTDASFSQAGDGTFGQIPVLGTAVLHEQNTEQQQGDIEQPDIFHLVYAPFKGRARRPERPACNRKHTNWRRAVP